MVGVGTRGQGRTVTDSPVPVDVVTEQEIIETGEAEVGRIIQALIPSFNFSSSTISDGAFRTSAGQTYESDGTRYTARLNKGFQIGEDGVLHAAVEFSHRDPTNRAGLSGSKQYTDSAIENNVLVVDPGDKERNFNRRNFRIGDAELDQVSGAFNYSNSIDGIGAEVYAFGDFSSVQNESGGFYRRANQLE